ncbi:MAG: response regulator [Candidatus Paracaedibacteraceae bacterium]|nr:response regulator [Candidatus Paracaedibacteraceae bacterium]
MDTKIKNTTLFILIFIWVLILSAVTYSANNSTQLEILHWGIVAAITIFGVSFLGLTFRDRRFLKFLSQHVQLTRAIANALGYHHEIVVFDEDGQTILTTHPHAYPSKREFLRKIMLRLSPTAEASQFKMWVDDCQPGVCLLVGGGDGLGQQKRWWLSHVSPLDHLQMNGKHYVLVALTDVTEYFDGYDQTRNNYKQLENFVDTIPFGLVYLNKTQHLVGLNETLTKWLGQSKERVLGQPLSDFIDFQKGGAASTGLVTVKPNKKQVFKALWFPPVSENGKISAGLLCKLDPSTKFEHMEDDNASTQECFLYAPIPSVILESTGVISALNFAFEELITDISSIDGTSLKVGDNFYDIIESAQVDEIVRKLNCSRETDGDVVPFDIRFKGGKMHSTAYVRVIKDSIVVTNDSPLIVQFIDTSEQKRLEQQFIQSQKMQAVGQLAGGIAHDFNNLLTAMIGFCDLLLQRYMPNDPSYTDIVQIKQNANRAANLVRQLLAFSRQQNLQPKVLNITDTLAELTALLRRLIGARIDLQMVHGRDLWPIMVDASQLEQVIINLAVNARDAMVEGGKLIIRTSQHTNKSSRQLGHDAMPVGDYVLIEVIDSGHGIDPETIEHIFEPFFSTKEVGAGTGLGLSTVYGIVKQTGGFVGVDSELNKGTSFKIYLPRYTGVEVILAPIVEAPAGDLTGNETIMLVEDEDAVRLFSARALRDKGYTIIEAENGNKALELVEQGEKFDLLVTDVVMPHMDGPTLCKKIRDIYPEMKTIFISGYTEDTFRKNLGHNADIHFLQKPFTLKDLAQKVKDVLRASDKAA